jgi:antitoxin component YwqK of YwqJK toxin-antitoxin module
MLSTIYPINYKDYPECMFAMLSAFLPKAEGEHLRRVAGKVVFRSRDRDGRTYRNGLLHSYDDNPAIVADNGTYKVWYKEGKIHRDGDLPAITRHDVQYQEWYRAGMLHRDGDLPAIIGSDNHREWYRNGKLHRDGDEPALTDGEMREWYRNGELHRDGDEPALIDRSRYGLVREWHKNGVFIKSENEEL